jgi:hypothetical protein
VSDPVGQVTIMDRGGTNRLLLPTFNTQVSWEVNRHGLLSTYIMAADAVAAGLDTTDVRGKWIEYDAGTAGLWGGVAMSGRLTDGLLEIGAASYHVLLRRRITDPLGDTFDNPPGSIFRSSVQPVGGYRPGTVVKLGAIDTAAGEFVEIDTQGDDVYESLLPRIADELGFEWNVAPDPAGGLPIANFGKRLGSDKTATVRLVEGVHVNLGSSWTEDLWEATTMAVGHGQDDSRYETVRADESLVDRFGNLASYHPYGDTRRTSTVLLRLHEIIHDFADPPAAVELRTNDWQGVWSTFREGDDITVELGSSGIVGTLRVLVRSLDTTTGELVVAGEGRRL